ncbi:uncharacterized protein LOC109949909 isoform X2 [Prunus persica]|uniref:uncharacterized protein LOC109949909 isoform X2 n=1 Tax=Prunus persica TaxID=3760 RepID=UPI0009AB4710|nr:uncharacterized protein LOC109949909 isoform X2 [Prunus persica]
MHLNFWMVLESLDSSNSDLSQSMSPDANLFQDENKLKLNKSLFSTSKDPRFVHLVGAKPQPQNSQGFKTGLRGETFTLSNIENTESPRNHLTNNLARIVVKTQYPSEGKMQIHERAVNTQTQRAWNHMGVPKVDPCI